MNAAAAGNDHELERIDYPHIFALGGGVGAFVLNSTEVMKDLSNLLFGNISGNNDDEALRLGIEVYTSNDDDNDDNDSNDEEINDFDAETIARAFQHLSRLAKEGGPRIFIGRIKYERTVQTTPILRLVSRNVESGYHSSLGEMDGAKVFDINYSLRGDKFLRGETHEAVQFRYNVATDRAIYLFSCKGTQEFHFYMASLDAYALPPNTPLHPFCIHLILLFRLVLSRGAHLEKLIRTLIAEEEGRRGGGAQQQEEGEEQGGGGHGNGESEVFVSSTNNDNKDDQSDLDAVETERHLRRLHGLFKDLTVGENINRRVMATVECLLRDLGRLRGYVLKWRRRKELSSSNSNNKEMVAPTQTEFCPSPLSPVQQQQQQEQQLQMFDWLDDSSDSDSDNQDDIIFNSPQSPSPPNHYHRHHRHHQQRLIDSFLCLQYFCSNRALRLNTRKERTTNLINLTYNLLANRNSLSSHRIAVESASIAHEARRDTVAMRTIAVLTMLFLPPAFISGLLGTNLIALETTGGGEGGGGGGGTRIVISELWWMYFVLTVPLTGATFGVWWLVTKRSKKKRRLGR